MPLIFFFWMEALLQLGCAFKIMKSTWFEKGLVILSIYSGMFLLLILIPFSLSLSVCLSVCLSLYSYMPHSLSIFPFHQSSHQPVHSLSFLSPPGLISLQTKWHLPPPQQQFQKIWTDGEFRFKMCHVYSSFEVYMDLDGWIQRSQNLLAKPFCRSCSNMKIFIQTTTNKPFQHNIQCTGIDYCPNVKI